MSRYVTSYWDDDYDDEDYDYDEEEGENPMTINDKKFYVVDASSDCGWYATQEEALTAAKRKTSQDRAGDPFMVLKSVQYAQAKIPEVDVTTMI